LETADTPEKVDAGLTRLLMQMEELEARYAESESLLESLSEKRAALCAVFEGARQRLVEARNRRADALVTAADRILTGIITRSQRMDSPAAIASFFASDLMVDKVRRIADQLRDLGDSVRMEDVLSRLKAISDDAVRLQRDRQDLLSDGNSLIKLGEHRFSVNQQPIELTTVVRYGKLNIHLTGTQFFQPISDPALDAASDLWDQNLPSESTRIYRSEYLA
jgi:chromosome segregation ATPase